MRGVGRCVAVGVGAGAGSGSGAMAGAMAVMRRFVMSSTQLEWVSTPLAASALSASIREQCREQSFELHVWLGSARGLAHVCGWLLVRVDVARMIVTRVLHLN